MGGQETDYQRQEAHRATLAALGYVDDSPTRFWTPLAPETAAGYDPDPLGGYLLIGLVIYSPNTDKVRGIRLRPIERVEVEPIPTLYQQHPPTPEQVAEAWALRTLLQNAAAAAGSPWASPGGPLAPTDDVIDTSRLREAQLATHPYELVRHPGDTPTDFYRRVARAHRALAQLTDKPTNELAKRAGVRPGTASMWVSRARARGLYPTEPEGEQ